MSIKNVISRQYRDNINAVRLKVSGVQTPPEGWLRTMRKALGMSGAQLARRIGLTRGAISINEKAELDGGITLRTMQHMAAAMNCRLVYAVIPEREVERIIEERAHEKATKLVTQASVHMALENQTLSKQRLNAEIERIARELLDTPSSLWNE